MSKKLVPYLTGTALAAILLSVAVVDPASAQNVTGSGLSQLRGLSIFGASGGNNTDSLYNALAGLINFLLIIAGLIAFFFALYGGFMYLTAGGNDANAEKGRKMITNAIIGLVIIFLSYAIIQYVIGHLTTSTTGSVGNFGG